jgi:hypothetical protein
MMKIKLKAKSPKLLLSALVFQLSAQRTYLYPMRFDIMRYLNKYLYWMGKIKILEIFM